MSKAAIIVNAFGADSGIRPNQILAEIARKQAETLLSAGHEVVIYTQRDISMAPIPGVEVVLTEEDDDTPTTTLRMNQRFVEWAVDNNVTQVWHAQAAPHWMRCTRDLARTIKESGAPIVAHTCYDDDFVDSDWFDANSTQKRTRSRREWWFWEMLLNSMPFWCYRIVAG